MTFKNTYKRSQKPPVLMGKDMPSSHLYDMIRVHCGNLVTVNVKSLHD